MCEYTYAWDISGKDRHRLKRLTLFMKFRSTWKIFLTFVWPQTRDSEMVFGILGLAQARNTILPVLYKYIWFDYLCRYVSFLLHVLGKKLPVVVFLLFRTFNTFYCSFS